MKSIEEILGDADVAYRNEDAHALMSSADALAAIGSPQGLFHSWMARGTAERLLGRYAEACASYDQAMSLSDEAADQRGLFMLLTRYGYLSSSLGSHDAAHEFFKRALESRDGNRSDMEVAHVTNMIGSTYRAQGDFGQALLYFFRALDMYAEDHSSLAYANACCNIGVTYMSCGAYPDAQEYLYRALKIFEEQANSIGAARAFHGLCNVMYMVGDHQLALHHGHRALAVYETLESPQGIASITDDLGLVHFALGEHEQALELYRRALDLHKEIGNAAGVAHATGNIIEALLACNALDEAEVLIEQQSMMTVVRPDVLAMHHVNRGRLLQQRDDLLGAERALRTGLQVAIDGGVRPEQALVHAHLRDLAELRGDLASYIEHNKAHIRVTEEIRGRESTQRVTMAEAQRQMEAERREREKEQAVLYSTLPRHVAERVVRGEKITGDHYASASVIFLDIVDFTRISDRIPPGHVVYLLEQVFTALDNLAEAHHVTKIKTIGDSYMAVSFGDEQANNMNTEQGHATHAAQFAIDALRTMEDLEIRMPPELGDTSWTTEVGEINVRIGLHCGPVTAGVIGTQRLQYDVWGDTVNVASRMESSGLPGRIQVSDAFAHNLGDGPWRVVSRGLVEVKGKGSMTTHWLEAEVPTRSGTAGK